MPCFVPFNSKDLDLTFLALRPTGVYAEELIDALKCFSVYAEELGCLHSSVFRSIHGCLVIWYGGWIKRTYDGRKLLHDILMSAIENLSSIAILLQYGFFESYAGESKDGRPLARFSSGDTISICLAVPISGDAIGDLAYTFLAIHKSCFSTVARVSAGVYLICRDSPMVTTFHVWESLGACYTWLFSSDYRNTIMPYISHLSNEVDYDVFKVCYVSTEELLNVRFVPPARAIKNIEETEQGEEGGAIVGAYVDMKPM